MIGNGHAGFGRAASEKDPQGTSPTSYLDHPPTPHRPGARRAPRRPARPHPPDRLARAASPAPHPPTDARAQKAGQRDHRCVRPRARLLPLGSRHRPITQADSPPARVGRRRAPKSAGTRGNTMGSPYQATPVLRHASAGDETRDLGCQPPHMRLTDVEDAPDASPREPKTLNPPATGGTMNAAHLTNVPPYECLSPLTPSSGVGTAGSVSSARGRSGRVDFIAAMSRHTLSPVTFLEAAAAVLRAAKRPLTTREITDIALQRGLLRTSGKRRRRS